MAEKRPGGDVRLPLLRGYKSLYELDADGFNRAYTLVQAALSQSNSVQENLNSMRVLIQLG